MHFISEIMLNVPLGTPSRGLWIYFLLMINSMVIFNFFAYGYSERWFADMKAYFGCGKSDTSSFSHSRGSSRASTRASTNQPVSIEMEVQASSNLESV